ncbi:MAG: uroporphyrinogen-III synthase [Ignavibacteriae bacterium]|nr:uroporphyrinogen-III synthase [Ignavibacteriota bacterium]
MNNILKNKNIVLTRPKEQSVQSVMDLERLGANVICFPTIKISSITNDPILDKTLTNIKDFNSIIFTSINAVKYFILRIEKVKVEFNPIDFYIISIGKKTSDYCKQVGIDVNFESSLFTSDSLIKELRNIDLVDKKIIVPSSSLSKPEQYKVLEELGAEVTSIPIYRNETNDIESLIKEIDILKNTKIDLYIFTSPSTFYSFSEIMEIKDHKKYFMNKSIAVIGPVTKEALNKVGIEPNIIPQNFSMNYLIEAIKVFYGKENLMQN